MKKYLIIILSVYSLITGLTCLIGNQANAKSNSNYQIIASKHVNTYKTLNSFNNNGILHVKNQYKNKNVYVWNKEHTKVLYNLKDFPNSYLSALTKQTYLHGGHKSLYYAAYIVTPKGNSSRYGRIWQGYLTKGYNRHYQKLNYLSTVGFTNDQDYLNYIQKSPSQVVARAVLKLFPNCKLSLRLSNLGQFNSDVDSTNKPFEEYFTNRINLQKVAAYLGPTRSKLTSSQRITKIKQTLVSEGYTTSKRHAMSHYVIGIYDPNPNMAWEEFVWSINLAKPL
ncbi:hypothetical protein G8J22_02468 [Lentilactobacillus hilgardii]|uniref:hypothetical protein n=1 Tax=Lentilactobacillus hilgardii TaxID=1588 RepID=UPI00019C479D|nr:hypothetical protein [Lentilactobacillus hilgardii]EEI19697.1 hypothetical protein HMPREF0497_1534 [Lentilactobacillus buchneri ATCC 11577]MCT3395234.1 hypothetical protein [Lentilactobacillus hilgardii]QIR10460.1 hypothetical protein G8J22_02468 [Lentilactobacillus hilgardii]